MSLTLAINLMKNNTIGYSCKLPWFAKELPDIFITYLQSQSMGHLGSCLLFLGEVKDAPDGVNAARVKEGIRGRGHCWMRKLRSRRKAKKWMKRHMSGCPASPGGNGDEDRRRDGRGRTQMAAPSSGVGKFRVIFEVVRENQNPKSYRQTERPLLFHVMIMSLVHLDMFDVVLEDERLLARGDAQNGYPPVDQQLSIQRKQSNRQ